MTRELEILKGIHPGLVLEKKLKENHIKKGRFALSINEYPQTLTAITKGKRDMNLPLALKIEEELGLEEGYFMMLQLYYKKIDWELQSRSVIRRVFERGNEQEKKEITRFYGQSRIDQILAENSIS